MMAEANADLTQYMLKLKESDDNEDSVLAVTALITSAAHDEQPAHTLREIYAALSQSSASSLLDPLSVVSIVLPSRNSGAEDILALVGEGSSAKEVAITAQEASERLRITMDEDDITEDATQQESVGIKLIRLVTLYSAAIPRFKLHKKSAYETIRPLIHELEKTTVSASEYTKREEGCEVVTAISRLVLLVMPWATEHAKDPSELAEVKTKLLLLLDNTLQSFSGNLETDVAQQKFESLYPRLAMRRSVSTKAQASQAALDLAAEANQAVGRTANQLIETPSLSSLLFLAHDPPSDTPPLKLLTSLFPFLLKSLQTNTVLNSSLSVILQALHTLSTLPSLPNLPPDFVLPLASTLSLLSASHPDPSTRHIIFRLLSLLLSLTDPPLHIAFLADTLSDPSTPPPMLIAAVGLVKDAVLRALASPKKSVWASPLLLSTFGSLVFRPDPPDLLEKVEVKAFVEGIEPRRLTECLTLYYVLIVRDTTNRTGVRDQDMVRDVENSLLTPLRRTLARWLADDEVQADHHLTMALAGLEIGLERIDGAMSEINRA